MTFCKHQPHKVLDHILEPKWSTREILINRDRILPNIEHYVIRFKKESAHREFGWFYMSGKMIKKHKLQANGNGYVYVVPLAKREEFVPVNNCEHKD